MTERSPEELFDCELRLLLEAVYHRYQHDFRHYAIASLRRYNSCSTTSACCVS